MASRRNPDSIPFQNVVEVPSNPTCQGQIRGLTLSRPPKALLRQLDKAVERRNKLVHSGEPPPKWDELEEMLRAVNDFLWMCDLYQGHLWAAKNISAEILNAWRGDDTKRPPK